MSLFLDWANDPDVRWQSFDSAPIPFERHRAWFTDKLAAAESRLFVLQARDLPVGQIRFDLKDGVASIDYSIEPLFRGRGWARRLVELGMQHYAAGAPVTFRAEVKVTNRSSQSVFRRLGFAESLAATAAGAEISVFSMTSAGQAPTARVS
jgi:RimJ/RimL family protein N-acetyltransferase